MDCLEPKLEQVMESSSCAAGASERQLRIGIVGILLMHMSVKCVVFQSTRTALAALRHLVMNISGDQIFP